MSLEPLKHLKIKDPLQIDLVLERIFWFCDVNSLKSIRLVSKKWKDLSIKSWREKAVIHLHPDLVEMPDSEEFLNLMDSEEEGQAPFQLRRHPFKRYSVVFDDGNTNGKETKRELMLRRVAVAIFNSRAHHVKINWKRSNFTGFDEFLFTLNSESLKDLEVVWRTLDYDIPHAVEPLTFSNLKRLKLVSRLDLLRHTPNRSLWRFLLQSFPKLETLSVGYDHSDYINCLLDRLGIVNLLKDIRLSSAGSLLALKELEMIDVNTNQDSYGSEGDETSIINALAECKFPFERLSIHAGWHGADGGEMISILPLLEACKDILKFLKISINFDGVLIFEAYQNLKGTTGVKSDLDLEKLEKICMEAVKEVQLLDGLDWAMFFLAHLKLPQLEKLIVSNERDNLLPKNADSTTTLIPFGHNRGRDGNYHLSSVWLPKEKIYERLRTFELHDNSNVLGPEMIREFARMMPNLTHLSIPLDKSTFPVICQHFKGLTTLHIFETRYQGWELELDDEALTGISKVQLRNGVMPVRPPNLTNLEHLFDLRISCQRQVKCNAVMFTESSVMYGFLQLPQLYNLSIAIKDLSKQMKEKLFSHVKGTVNLQTKPMEPKAAPQNCADFRRERLKLIEEIKNGSA